MKFPTITAAHWAESIARSRATPNTIKLKLAQRRLLEKAVPVSPRLVCPDCGSKICKIDLDPVPMSEFGTFYECPECKVGSLVSSWKTAEGIHHEEHEGNEADRHCNFNH